MMKKRIGIALAMLLCLMMPFSALAEDGEGADATAEPEVTATAEPEVTATEEPEVIATEEPEVTATEEPEVTATEEPEVIATAEPEPTEAAPDSIVISPAQSDSGVYKDLLMNAFDQTPFAKNVSLRAQIAKILYHDAVKVTADNYNRILLLARTRCIRNSSRKTRRSITIPRRITQ